jgi:hypothetical protein
MEYIYIEWISVIGTFYVGIYGNLKMAVVLIQIGHEILLNLTKIILLFGLLHFEWKLIFYCGILWVCKHGYK